MAFDISRYSAQLNCFAVWNKAFDDDEIEKIQFLEELQTFTPGLIGQEGSNSNPVKDFRNSDVAWIHPDQHSQWVFERLGGITARVNYDHFLYNIRGIEALQYTRYGPDQHYSWHWDLMNNMYQNYERKISLVMSLSDPNEYEGGEFEICNTGI